jgi:hypothetical protein
MNEGDVVWFYAAAHALGTKQFDLSTDVLKMGITKGLTTPSATTAAPHWGGVGSVDFSTEEVNKGSVYTGPITLSNKSFNFDASGVYLAADNILLNMDVASGFFDGTYGVIFNATDVKKRALAFVYLGTVNLSRAPFALDWFGPQNKVLSLVQ